MKTIAMYSYKGGSGRTVSTANIASILATEMGKKVACVDFDIEGPGLKIVFGVNPEGADSHVQDYLNSSTAQDFNIQRAFIDVSSFLYSPRLEEGRLYIFPASQDFKKRLPDNYDFFQISDRIKYLKEKVEELIKPDFLFLDCPSGWRIMPKACTQASDLVMIFLRFARQHLLGTMTIARLLDFMNNNFCFIPSAVPQSLIDQNARVEAFRRALEDTFPQHVFPEIPEDERLKWDEAPLILDEETVRDHEEQHRRGAFDNILEKYRMIAQRTLERSQSP